MTWPLARKLSGRPFRRIATVIVAFLLVMAWGAWWPLPPLFNTPRSTVLLDRQGALLGASVAADGQWRFPRRDPVPERFVSCLLTFEDRYFRSHPGVHLPSLVRAFVQNWRAGRVVSGGSTLTMQLARLSLGRTGRSYGNKLLEALFALRIELAMDKADILAEYCANAPFGGNVVGLDAAAWRYYGRPPEQLSWSECATLAVLPNAPSSIYPGKGQDALRAKRDRLLDRLLEGGLIDRTERSLAIEEPLPAEVRALPRRAPHLLSMLMARGHAGTVVRSTIDGALQDRVRQVLDRLAPVLQANEVHNAAALVLDMPTGEVLAYVGNLSAAGRDHAGQVDLVQALRSTGSLLKPFLHADMLACGEILPDMLVADVPTRFDAFAPRNYDGRYTGAVPAGEALARSLNIPAVRALRKHGVERTLRTLRAIGLTDIDRSAEHYGLSLIMGGAESSLWSLTGAYASMARLVHDHGRAGAAYHPGTIHPPVAVRAARTAGQAPPQDTPPPFSAAAAHLTLKALRDVKRPEEEAGWERFQGRPGIAWKTGTSVGHRDAWAIGTDGGHTVGVWTGNADGEGRPGLTGTLAAAPVLFQVFSGLPARPLPEPPFDELVKAPVCRATGHRTGPDCPVLDTVYIPVTGMRTAVCPYHRTVLIDPTGTRRVRPGEPGRPQCWLVLPPAMEHYRALSDPTYRPLPPFADGNDTEGAPMEVLYPEQGARLLLPIELDGTMGHAVVEVAHRDAGAAVDWDLDGSYLGRTQGEHRMALAPAVGPHRLTLTDQRGNRIEHRFQVVSGRATAP